MQVNEIENPDVLESLRPEWTELWQRTATAGPFQHPDWLLGWWRHFGGRELWVLVVRDKGCLVAVAPFYIYSGSASRPRQLTLIGNGISDTCDILIDPDVFGVDRALACRLHATQQFWCSYDFRDLPENSALLQMVRSQFGGSVIEDAPCVTIALDAWRARPSAAGPERIVTDLRRCRRRAEELGTLRVELASTFDLSDALEALFRLHARRWRAVGQEGVLNGTELHAFHREIAAQFSQRKWLRLYRLFLGGRLIAASYGFFLRSRAYYYIAGFDPEFAKFSPGKMLLYHFISEAAAGDAIEFDFLRGVEEYKFRWGGKSRLQYRAISAARI